MESEKNPGSKFRPHNELLIFSALSIGVVALKGAAMATKHRKERLSVGLPMPNSWAEYINRDMQNTQNKT